MAERQGWIAERDFAINERACEWTVRAISALKARLKLNIKIHHKEGDLTSGEIFLFNHFARFETFIPQYLINAETGAYCRSIASSEFFDEDNTFSRYLLGLGAVPNTYPRLLPFLAEEILKGRKVVVFTEGGMVKDRLVLDPHGEYSVYSRTAKTRRKHHSGAAVLALTLDAFKTGILENHKGGKIACLEYWAGKLELGNVDALIAAARRPTLVAPSNITFYPIRVDENLLKRGAEFFFKGLNPQLSEELLIEGNLLLKHTDMDIRVGDLIHTGKTWSWMERKLLGLTIRRIKSLDDLFEATCDAGSWKERLVDVCIRNHVQPMSDAYMHAMYSEVSINLNHLASRLILMEMDRGRTLVACDQFHRTLYLALKNAQREPAIHLHRGLRNPETYDGLLEGRCASLDQFISSTSRLGLVNRQENGYHFLPKLRQEHDFDQIRMENPIVVYANEMAPIRGAWYALEKAGEAAAGIDDKELARLCLDDEVRAYAWDKKKFASGKYGRINDQETATEDGTPYLIVPPDGGKGLGIVLVHGFLASPAELRKLGERIAAAGHPVIGVRLKGHGTSPHDLSTRSWEEWLDSVRRGYEILSPFAERVCIVGFSTGGSLALIHAAQEPEKLAGVVVASAPLKFRNKGLIFVPLLHGANKLTEWMPAIENLMSFRKNESEHPDINYRHIPIRGLHELRRVTAEMNRRLKEVTCPALIIQGDADTVVDPHSADLIERKLASPDKTLHIVASHRHGILNENIGGAQDLVLAFLERLTIDVDGLPHAEVIARHGNVTKV